MSYAEALELSKKLLPKKKLEKLALQKIIM